MSRLSELMHRIGDHSTKSVIDEFSVLLRGGAPGVPVPAPKPAGPKHGDPWFDSAGRPIWLTRAIGYIGTKEVPGAGDNPVILNWAKGQGGDTGRDYNHDSIPWCALFAWVCVRECGLNYPDTLWALDALKWGIGLGGPALGALAVMKRDGGGHNTFVAGRDQHGNIMCCGGNQSDAVNIMPFDPDRVVSHGYRWPLEAPLPRLVGFDTLPLISSDGAVSRDEG